MKTILIVDDYASVRFYHQSLLRGAGFDTLPAADGIEALEILDRHPVDLVLLDLHMPRMPGREFLARVRAHHRHAQVPVVVITSENAPEAADPALAAARCSILHKPVLPDQMLGEIRRLVA